MQTKIDFSPTESGILRLKIGRCNSDFFDESSLYKQIIESKYDLCRLKVCAEDELAPYRLNKLGIPYFFSGSIRRYKTRISEKPSGKYNHPDLIFEVYDGTQDRLLKDMIIGTWGTYPIGYYRSPYLRELINKEMESESLFQFYKKANLNKVNPQNSIVFIKHNDAYVGFFALNIINNNLESHIGGILEPYRKGGYFLDKLRYIKEYCIDHGLENFLFGARNENSEVQGIFQFVGFRSYGSENVFHIPSLLSYSRTAPMIKEINLTAGDPKSTYQILLLNVLDITQHIAIGYNNISFSLNQVEKVLVGKKVKVKFSFPIITDSELLIVLQSGQDDTTPFTGYFRAYLPDKNIIAS